MDNESETSGSNVSGGWVSAAIYRDSKKSKNPITLGWFRSLRTFISDSTISKCPLTVFFEMILIATSFLSLIRTALRTEPKEPRPNKDKRCQTRMSDLEHVAYVLSIKDREREKEKGRVKERGWTMFLPSSLSNV